MTAFLTLLIAYSCSSVNLHEPSLAFCTPWWAQSLHSRVWIAIFVVMFLSTFMKLPVHTFKVLIQC